MSQRRHSEPLPLGNDDLPYSKGLMARALIATGVPADQAYGLARRIEVDLAEAGESAATLERLDVLAREVLGEDFHRTFVDYKRGEWDTYNTIVTEWEREQYLRLW